MFVTNKWGSFLASILAFSLVLPAAACTKNANEITIGAVMDLTGDLSVNATQVRNAVQLATDQINAAGGINGAQVKLVVRDGKTNPNEGFNAVKELIEDNRVKVIIGPLISSAVLLSGQYAMDHGVLLVSPSATSPDISVQPWRKFVFRTIASDALQGDAMGDLATDAGYKKIAILAIDNSYGTGVANVLTENLASSATIVTTIKYDATKKDYTSELKTIMALAPDCVMHIGYNEDASVIYKQALQLGFTGAKWIASEGVYGTQTLQSAESAQFMAASVIGTRSVAPSGWQPYATFATAYKAAFNIEPGVYCDTAYDATMIVLNSLKKSGVSDSSKISTEVLKEAQNYMGASGVVTLAGNGDRVSGSYEVWKVVKTGTIYTYQQVDVIKL